MKKVKFGTAAKVILLTIITFGLYGAYWAMNQSMEEEYIEDEEVKLDVYRKLTSKQADPQGDVTYDQFVDAVVESVSYNAGYTAATAIMKSAMGVAGPLSILGIVLPPKKTKEQKANSVI